MADVESAVKHLMTKRPSKSIIKLHLVMEDGISKITLEQFIDTATWEKLRAILLESQKSAG
jgi:hypothetical protein